MTGEQLKGKGDFKICTVIGRISVLGTERSKEGVWRLMSVVWMR